MSWSCSGKFTKGPGLDEALDGLTTGDDNPHHHDQLRVAKRAAAVLLDTVPGPLVSVTLSGHANGVGWQAKPGWASDCISISVTQAYA